MNFRKNKKTVENPAGIDHVRAGLACRMRMQMGAALCTLCAHHPVVGLHATPCAL